MQRINDKDNNDDDGEVQEDTFDLTQDLVLRSHHDPFLFAPASLKEITLPTVSRLLQAHDVVEGSANGEHERSPQRLGRFNYGERVYNAQGAIIHVLYSTPNASQRRPYHTLDRLKHATVDFLLTYHQSTNLPLRATLLADPAVLYYLHEGRKEFISRWRETETSLARKIICTLLLSDENEARLTEEELSSDCLASRTPPEFGGAYFGLVLDNDNRIQGLYVGRTRTLAIRARAHEVKLALSIKNVAATQHIEQLFYQRAAGAINSGGRLVFVSVNVLEVVSQGEYIGKTAWREGKAHLERTRRRL